LFPVFRHGGRTSENGYVPVQGHRRGGDRCAAFGQQKTPYGLMSVLGGDEPREWPGHVVTSEQDIEKRTGIRGPAHLGNRAVVGWRHVVQPPDRHGAIRAPVHPR
jgi:hypothetical protein